jgi:hypothetical protein
MKVALSRVPALSACLLGIATWIAPSIGRAQEQEPEAAPPPAPSAPTSPDQTTPYPECSKRPSDAEVEGAKGAFRAGTASFAEADYPRAILYWEDAFRRDCTAYKLLLNLARAYESNNQKAQAVVALETYLARAPTAEDRDLILKRIEVLNRQIEEARATASQSSAPPPPPRAAPAAPTEPRPVQAEEGGRPVAPLVVAGIGGAIALAGGVVYFTAAKDVADFEDECQKRKCPDKATRDSANAARTRLSIGGATAIGGAAVAGVGLLWYFLSPSGDDSESALVPMLSPGVAGLSYSRRF